MAAGPVQLGWSDAERVLSHEPDRGGPVVVCIAGAVGSGKTTLAKRYAGRTGGLMISTDDYLPDYHQTPEHLRDEPDAAHLDELCAHLTDLIGGRSAVLPVWSFHEHRRVGSRRVDPAATIIVEGIHGLHETLDTVRSVGVLVEASRETRWTRWAILEATGQRGWGVERARVFFEDVADPTFERHLPAYRARADFLVVNDDVRPAKP